jgi:hypothetical protein
VDEALGNVFSLCAVVIVRNGASIRPSLEDYLCIFKFMGAWQMRHVLNEDENDNGNDISFDSKLTLTQNITEWQTKHGRMHICRAVYERTYTTLANTSSDLEMVKINSSGNERAGASATATSANMLNSYEIVSDILLDTLRIQDMNEENRTDIRMRNNYK